MIFKNPLSELSYEKLVAKYAADLEKDPRMHAYKSGGIKVLLYKFKPSNLAFVSGEWRVQDDHPEIKLNTEIETRGERFLIQEKLPDRANNFTYYSALKLPLCFNCYGPLSLTPEYILSNLHDHWGFGKTIADASAFLSRRLADIYRNAIDVAIEKEKQVKK